jgi:hypothetical protein
MSLKNQEIRFSYEYQEGYGPHYVNGALGGVSPRGEIIANFFFEKPTLPTMVANEITPNGTIGGEVVEEPADMRNSFVRSVATGIVLNYDNARNLHSWLGEKIKELEFLQQGQGALPPGIKEFGH